MEWKRTTPEPILAKERHELQGRHFRLSLSSGDDGRFVGGGYVENYNVTGKSVATLGEAKLTALQNMREYVAAALAELDAAIIEAVPDRETVGTK